MQVTIEINGRQALPVRAIPLLTYWEVLSPDVCANAFAGDECTAQHLEGLPTYRLDDKGEPQPVSALEWANYHVRALDACSTRIKSTQSDHEVGYQQWRSESLGLLPAGVFVWRDEFESAFLLEYGPESMRARFAGADYEQDRHRLNFDPQYGPRNDWKTLVMEGFERVQPQATGQVAVVADSASNGPLPLTTGDIAFCFDGIRWNEQQWRKPLGDKPKWLQSCVAIPGQQGVSETRWNPVLMAAALVRDGHAQARSIRARFQTKPQLKDWLEAWKTYEADNFDAQ